MRLSEVTFLAFAAETAGSCPRMHRRSKVSAVRFRPDGHELPLSRWGVILKGLFPRTSSKCIASPHDTEFT
jgi:hypothetical protein